MDSNASQALKIAGGLLIAVLIIASLVLFYKKLAPFQQQVDEQKEKEQIAEYNKTFLAYDKPLMYGVDIVSILNKAANTNIDYIEKYGYDEKYLIDISVNIKSDIQEKLSVYCVKKNTTTGKVSENLTGTSSIKTEDWNYIYEQCGKPTNFGSLKSLDPVLAISSGNYTLLSKTNSVPVKYCNKELGTIVKNSKNNLKKTITNPKSPGLSGTEIWSKAIFETSAFDMKNKKFKCTKTEYNDITGRVCKMYFEEIKQSGT